MSVVISVEEVGPCRKRLQVEVPAPAVEAETARVMVEIGRRAQLPGFRKGKVPAEIVRRRFAEEIRREVVERLVPRYWREAVAEKRIDALLPPEVGPVEYEPGSNLAFTATVETRPEIELRNIHDFKLPEFPVEPQPEEVAATIERLRRERATWKEVARTAANGDRVMVEVSELQVDGPGKPQSLEVELGSPQVWEELSLAVNGAVAGQTVSFSRREGEGEETHEHRFEARVLTVKEAELPALDDAFATSLGHLASLRELEADVERSLRAARLEERRRRREQAVLEQLRERHRFPLPQAVVDHEIEHLLREYAESLSRRGVDLEHAKIDWQGLAGEVKPQAERRVEARLLLDAVADSQNIAVAEEEFERALAAIARSSGRSTVAIRQELDQSGQLGKLRAQMRREKSLSFLLGEEASTLEPSAELSAESGG